MDFLKRQLFFIICGVGAVGGVVLAGMGWKASPAIQQELQQATKTYSDLNALASSPVSEEHIRVEQRRIEAVVRDRDEILSKAIEVNRWEPLVPGYFPRCEMDKEEAFKVAYRDALMDLLASLKYGEPATRTEIELMKDQIAKEERDRNLDATLSGGRVAPPPPDGPPLTPGMVLTRDGARTDPVARANMQKAQMFWCYATNPFGPDTRGARPPSLQVIEKVITTIGTSEKPSFMESWMAQVTLWIQTDVVKAIRTINEQAAERFRESQRDVDEADRRSPWVGVLPVKELISIRVSDYVHYDDGRSPQVGGDEAGDLSRAAFPPGSNLGTFTERACEPEYDVLQFTVKLVMDQRDMPKLIQEISKNRFHTLLRVSYRSLPPNRLMRGRIYGEGPVVLVVMDFETVMLAEIYRNPKNPLMPAVVADDLGFSYPE